MIRNFQEALEYIRQEPPGEVERLLALLEDPTIDPANPSENVQDANMIRLALPYTNTAGTDQAIAEDIETDLRQRAGPQATAMNALALGRFLLDKPQNLDEDATYQRVLGELTQTAVRDWEQGKRAELQAQGLDNAEINRRMQTDPTIQAERFELTQGAGLDERRDQAEQQVRTEANNNPALQRRLERYDENYARLDRPQRDVALDRVRHEAQTRANFYAQQQITAEAARLGTPVSAERQAQIQREQYEQVSRQLVQEHHARVVARVQARIQRATTDEERTRWQNHLTNVNNRQQQYEDHVVHPQERGQNRQNPPNPQPTPPPTPSQNPQAPQAGARQNPQRGKRTGIGGFFNPPANPRHVQTPQRIQAILDRQQQRTQKLQEERQRQFERGRNLRTERRSNSLEGSIQRTQRALERAQRQNASVQRLQQLEARIQRIRQRQQQVEQNGAPTVATPLKPVQATVARVRSSLKNRQPLIKSEKVRSGLKIAGQASVMGPFAPAIWQTKKGKAITSAVQKRISAAGKGASKAVGAVGKLSVGIEKNILSPYAVIAIPKQLYHTAKRIGNFMANKIPALRPIRDGVVRLQSRATNTSFLSRIRSFFLRAANFLKLGPSGWMKALKSRFAKFLTNHPKTARVLSFFKDAGKGIGKTLTYGPADLVRKGLLALAKLLKKIKLPSWLTKGLKVLGKWTGGLGKFLSFGPAQWLGKGLRWLGKKFGKAAKDIAKVALNALKNLALNILNKVGFAALQGLLSSFLPAGVPIIVYIWVFMNLAMGAVLIILIVIEILTAPIAGIVDFFLPHYDPSDWARSCLTLVATTNTIEKAEDFKREGEGNKTQQTGTIYSGIDYDMQNAPDLPLFFSPFKFALGINYTDTQQKESVIYTSGFWATNGKQDKKPTNIDKYLAMARLAASTICEFSQVTYTQNSAVRDIIANLPFVGSDKRIIFIDSADLNTIDIPTNRYPGDRVDELRNAVKNAKPCSFINGSISENLDRPSIGPLYLVDIDQCKSTLISVLITDPLWQGYYQEDAQAKFLIAKGFAETFIYPYLSVLQNDGDYKNSFKKSIWQNGGHLLPTDPCSFSDKTDRACITDSIGEFFVFPFYRFSSNNIANTPTPIPSGTQTPPTNTPAPTPTATPTPIPLPSATGSPVPTPPAPSPTGNPTVDTFLDFPTGDFSDYYAYTKKILGDDVWVTKGDMTCPKPLDTTATTTSIETTLENDYGIHVVGDVDPEKDASRMKTIYNNFCMMYTAPTYKSLLGATTSNPVDIYIDPHFSCGTGHAGGSECSSEQGANGRCAAVGWCSDPNASVFLIDHEVAHLLYYNSKDIQGKYHDSGIYSDDPTKDIPTFNCQHDYDNNTCNPKDLHSPCSDASCTAKCVGPYYGECFADMVGEYMVYNQYKHDDTLFNRSVNFSSYPSTWGNWYSFALQNIFDNKDPYQAPPSDTSYASAVTDGLINACRINPGDKLGTVNYGTVHVAQTCNINAVTALAAQGKQDILGDVSSLGGNLQCGTYAKVLTKDVLPNVAAAKDYAYNPTVGYTFIKFNAGVKLLPGDMVIWDWSSNPAIGNPFGHIAYVLQANYEADGTTLHSFRVAEASGGSGTVGFTIYSLGQNFTSPSQELYIKGWLRKK